LLGIYPILQLRQFANFRKKCVGNIESYSTEKIKSWLAVSRIQCSFELHF